MTFGGFIGRCLSKFAALPAQLTKHSNRIPRIHPSNLSDCALIRVSGPSR
jgi:hypothetical protein